MDSTSSVSIVAKCTGVSLNTGSERSTRPMKQECSHYCHGSRGTWCRVFNSFACFLSLALAIIGRPRRTRKQNRDAKRHAIVVLSKTGWKTDTKCICSKKPRICSKKLPVRLHGGNISTRQQTILLTTRNTMTAVHTGAAIHITLQVISSWKAVAHSASVRKARSTRF